MKLLLDQNLPPRLASVLHQEGFPGSAHVRDHGLDRATDETIWRFAADNGYAILSKDEDFHQLSFLHGAPPKVVWLRVGNRSAAEIERLLHDHAGEIRDFERDAEGAFLVIGP